MRKEKGITLIALVVTIVVLIILASISIATLTGDNGIINQAQDAKEQTEISEEKEIVSLASTRAAGEDKYGNVTKENLTKELNDLAGDGKTSVTGNGPFTVTFTESERSYVVEVNGKILDEEEIAELDKKAIKFLVNSGNDGFVVIPVGLYEWKKGEFEVDWGDGTTGVDDMFLSQTDVKIASTNETYVAAANPDGVPHIYSDKDKEYIVTITGTCSVIASDYSNVTVDLIIEVLQWGETGLERIDLGRCSNLRKIASPSENSFINIDAESGFTDSFSECTSLTEIPEDLFSNCSQVKDFSETFEFCIGLEKIPEDLFSNCPNAISFDGTFSYCENLTEIPENLFVNCQKVEDFRQTFYYCTNLTGNAINLWQRVPNGASNAYIGVPNGRECYYSCEKLNDYYEIPEYWRVLPDT